MYTDKPSQALLESMALRFDHAFGLLKEEDQERKTILIIMRQLWEEVAGLGYYDGPDTIRAYRTKIAELEKKLEVPHETQ